MVNGITHIFEIVCVIVYAIPALMVWRSLTGYAAWRIHTTARSRSGTEPELEDWIWGAITTALVALPFWWLVLPFKFAPRLLKSASEQEGERLSQQIKVQRLALESQRALKELESGEQEEHDGD